MKQTLWCAAALTLALGMTGCFTADKPETYRCSAAKRDCPDGYECVPGKWECIKKGSGLDGQVDGPMADKGKDMAADKGKDMAADKGKDMAADTKPWLDATPLPDQKVPDMVQPDTFNPTAPWVASGGGPSSDYGLSFTMDGQGNSYIAGTYAGTAKFGTKSITSAGAFEAFVVKLKPDGSFAWAASAGGTDSDRANGVAVDGSGNVYITGWYRGSAKFGSTTLKSKGTSDIFVAKLSSAGNFIWAKSAGGTDSDTGQAIASLGSAGVIMAGDIQSSTATFGNKNTSSKGSFVAKLDAAGAFSWVTDYGGNVDTKVLGLALDASGNSHVTGNFKGTGKFGSKTITAMGEDAYVAKLGSTGNFVWTTVAGGSSTDGGIAITTDLSGNSYVAGIFTASVSFGSHTITSKGLRDAFVAKLNPSGTFLWVTGAGGSGKDTAQGIALDSSGNIFAVGQFGTPSATFGSTTLSSSNVDIFVTKLSSLGVITWATSAGGSHTDYGRNVALDTQGNCLVSGDFGYGGGTDPASFGKLTATSAGHADPFVWKFKKP